MPEMPYKIILVEPDADVTEIVVNALVRRFDAYITCVSTAEDCLDTELVEPHDLVITDLDLAHDDGLDLAEQLFTLSARPVFVLADDPDRDDMVRAMQVGVRQMFVKPFPVGELLDAADAALRSYTLKRKQLVRHRRTRDLLRQVIGERRELNRRIDLICRDLVGAHRRLVNRVIEKEEVATDR